MGDSYEELEPLFDYHRVQPDIVILDDDSDSDSSPSNSPKRRKSSKTGGNSESTSEIHSQRRKIENDEDSNDEKGKSIQVIDDEEEEDKENWLPPPPKNVGAPSKTFEDSTLKELRLKKQQLASVVQSTEHLLRATDEARSKTFACSSHSVTEETTEDLRKPAVDRTKIVISIQDKAGTKQYRVYADDKFEQLFQNYAKKANVDVHSLVFSFDGDKINAATTPQSLGMEDDDLIEVHVKAC